MTGGVSGEVEIPGLKIEEGRGVIASMNGPAADNAGRVTVEASGYVTAEGGEKALTGAVATEIKAALEIDGATPKSVTFDFSLDGQVKLLEKVDGIKNALGGIANGTARVEFNLEDEQVKAAAMTVADAVKRGDVQGAVAALDDVMDRAEIVLQGNAGASAGALDADFDAFVVEAGLKETRLVNVVTVVKPPGGSFYQMDPDG